METVWEGELSGGRWSASVERIPDSNGRGVLTVRDRSGRALRSREVPTGSTSADGAPDPAAVRAWSALLSSWVRDMP